MVAGDEFSKKNVGTLEILVLNLQGTLLFPLYLFLDIRSRLGGVQRGRSGTSLEEVTFEIADLEFGSHVRL